MIGRRVKITSVTMNFTFRNLDIDNSPPELRLMAFLMKEGEPPSDISAMFTTGDVPTNWYWTDALRFQKKTLMDRKFTFSLDRPVIQRTFKFKIPARYITTPSSYNNLYFLILSHSAGTTSPYMSFDYTSRVNFHDS